MARSIITSKTVAGLVVTLIIGLVGWLLLVKPELARLTGQISERDRLKQELADITQKQALLTEVQANYEQIQADIGKLATAIPDASHTGEYLAALEQLASTSGVSITNLSTSLQEKRAPIKTNDDKGKKARVSKPKTLEEELLTQYYSTGVELKLTSNYASLYSFLTRLMNMDRFTVLGSVNVINSGDPNALTSTVTVSIYHRNAS